MVLGEWKKMNPFILEEMLIPVLLLVALGVWVYLNNSKKFDKGVKKTRFKPEESDKEKEQ